MKTTSVVLRFLVMAGVAIILAPSTAPADPRPQTAEEVVARYVDAIGGDQALKSVRTLRLTGKHREQGFEIDMEIVWRRPNVRRVNWRLSPQVEGAEGFDGTAPWEVNHKSGKAELLTGVQADAARRGAEFDESFVDARAKGTRVVLVGREILDGRAANHLRVTLADGGVKEYYLDAETGLIMALKKAMPIHGQGKPVSSITRYRDYRRVGGLLYPYSFEETNAETGAWLSSDAWTRVEVNPNLDESLLRAPNRLAGE
jgi:aryl carrier-like protein